MEACPPCDFSNVRSSPCHATEKNASKARGDLLWAGRRRVGVVASYCVLTFGNDILSGISRTYGRFSAQDAVVCAVLLAGIAAYIFKKKSQMWYGVFEVVFAGVCAIKVASGMSFAEAVL